MRGFFGICSNLRFLVILYSSIRVSEAGRWSPNINFPRNGPLQNSSTVISTTSRPGNTLTTQQTSSSSASLQHSFVASITDPLSNGTTSLLPSSSKSRPSSSSSSSFVTALASNGSVAVQEIPSTSISVRSSSAVNIVPASNGTVQQKLSTSSSSQNSSVAITPGLAPNGTAATRPTPVTSSHAITSPPSVFPIKSNSSVPQTCFDLGFYFLHPEWVGNQTVPDNTCSRTTTDTAGVVCPTWSSCTVDVGTVQLVYFPPASGNVSNPSTLYDPKYDYTFTSPSVYGVWTKMNGWNECNGVTNAPLGFSLTSVIQAFDITDIRSSLYWGSTTLTSNGKVQTIYSWEQLHLSDLYSDCPTSVAAQSTTEISASPHAAWFQEFPNGHAGSGPVPRDYRCNPQLAIPLIATQEGWPWWRDCNLHNGFNGMPDPPYALNVSGKPFPSDNGQPVSSASPAPGPGGSRILNQAPSTSPVQGGNPPTATGTPGSPQQNTVISPQPGSSNGNGPEGSNAPIQNSQAVNPNPNPGATSPQGQSPGQSQGPAAQPPQTQPQPPAQSITAVSVAVIGTNVISALPPATNNGASTPAAIVLPGGSTLLSGNVATVPANDGSGNSVVVSAPTAGGNGNLVVSTLGSPSAGTYNVNDALSQGNPGAGTPGAVTTVAGLNNAVLSYGASGVAVQNPGGGLTTLTPGGPAATVGNQGAVLSYGSQGVVVQYPGGQVSTLAAPTNNPAVAPNGGTTVAGLNNAVLNYVPSGVVVKGSDGASTTLSAGGPAMTLSSNTILSYGPSGVVVQYPGGGISTLPPPTPATVAPNGLVTTIAALSNAVISYAPSGAVIQGSSGTPTTLSLGGPVMTIGNAVLSYGPSGVVVQYPGGSISTIAPPASSTGVGVAPLINQIINGVSTTAASSSGSGTGNSVGKATGSSSIAGGGGGSGKASSLPSSVVKGEAGSRLAGTWLCVLGALISLAVAW